MAMPLHVHTHTGDGAAPVALQVGSITDNRLGGWYAYRSSKAALNQLSKTMALEFERRRQQVAVILLHPGTCDTDLSKPFQKVGGLGCEVTAATGCT